MALEQWALPRLSELLPLDEDSLKQIIVYTNSLPPPQAAEHLETLLGDSKDAEQFIADYKVQAAQSQAQAQDQDATMYQQSNGDSKHPTQDNTMSKLPKGDSTYPAKNGTTPKHTNGDSAHPQQAGSSKPDELPSYQPPAYAPPQNTSVARRRPHTNQVIEAAHVRARDEQQMQQMLQNLQNQYGIYNSEIEPEHEVEYYCSCPIHRYKQMKWNRYGVQDMWSRAVIYPGEKTYNEGYQSTAVMFSSNPYKARVVSPYGYYQSSWGIQKPRPDSHAQMIHQMIALNNRFNREAQANIDAQEPRVNIWDDGDLSSTMSKMALDQKRPVEKASDSKRQSIVRFPEKDQGEPSTKPSKLSGFRKSLGIKSSEERAIGKIMKEAAAGRDLRNAIVEEEQARWPDHQWRFIVATYQDKVGMTRKIADLRVRHPIQYLHLLRAGYFEPIPVAWAGAASNPLKFSIESAAGWRGITPQWRGYEDTAEERLYWVLNHREGSVGMRMKPDFISEMNMARARMASAVEPPPEYYSPNDVCHTQHTSPGYSKQVMPSPFRPFDRPEVPSDDTMILLDVSGSMDFEPVRPNYNQYLITGYSRSTQPRNKDVAKAIIRRFTDAMANHDHDFRGYDLTTFASQAAYIGSITHRNLDDMWRNVRIGGGTRVMTGWQKCKDMHFQKHSASAIHHPIYGWQAGPETPMLRLLLLLDGEATDMDEFELDLLGLSWAHVTIFLIGVDGCPHHHRHANELQRISDVNHHVNFVDAQGNTPERFVTHELLKRHLGYDISMREFETMEELPAYTE